MCEERQQQCTDAELVRRMQRGELDAFDMLFERHRRGLLAYVEGRTGDRPLAEDVVQDAFVRLARCIDRIDARRGVAPWLYRVARNRSVDLRRRRRFESLPGDERLLQRRDRTPDPAAEPAAALARAEERQRVRDALERLAPRDRELLMLRFYGEMAFREIARTVRRPLGTVLWQTRRALERLETAMRRRDREIGGDVS